MIGGWIMGYSSIGRDDTFNREDCQECSLLWVFRGIIAVLIRKYPVVVIFLLKE